MQARYHGTVCSQANEPASGLLVVCLVDHEIVWAALLLDSLLS